MHFTFLFYFNSFVHIAWCFGSYVSFKSLFYKSEELKFFDKNVIFVNKPSGLQIKQVLKYHTKKCMMTQALFWLVSVPAKFLIIRFTVSFIYTKQGSIANFYFTRESLAPNGRGIKTWTFSLPPPFTSHLLICNQGQSLLTPVSLVLCSTSNFHREIIKINDACNKY